MLSIIIASYNREIYLKQILNDLSSSKQFKLINLTLVLYNNCDYLSDNFFKKLSKFKNIKIIRENNSLSFQNRFIKYIKKSKSNFTWYISDDDRIYINSLSKILNFLKKNSNIDGLTLSYDSKIEKKINNKIFNFKKTKLKQRNFDINKDYYMIGFISSQIYNTKIIKKFLIKKNFKYLNAYIHTNFLLNHTTNWKIIENKIVIFRVGNLDNKSGKHLSKRLNYEFTYLPALKKNFKNQYPILFEKIFFKHLISWIRLNKILNGIVSTLRIININKRLIKLNIKILLTLLLILLLPNFLLKKLNKIKKYKN
tara:strand:- start:3030 stop:3962 length:933 start_codon:yes stop_codon:yes gene_type:complete